MLNHISLCHSLYKQVSSAENSLNKDSFWHGGASVEILLGVQKATKGEMVVLCRPED